MTEISQIIKQLMEEEGITPADLSVKSGVESSTLHRIIKGTTKNPTIESIKPIANYFKITISQLIGEEKITNSSDEKKSIEQSKINFSIRKVPLIDKNNLNKKDIFLIKKSEHWIPVEQNVSDLAFAIKITDTNMSPAIPENAIVVIEPKLSPINGDFILIQEEDKFLIKYYIFKGNDKLILSFLNNFDRIEPILPEHKILGTVVRVIYDRKS